MVLLFDLHLMFPEGEVQPLARQFDRLLEQVLCNPSITKLGFGLDQDMAVLARYSKSKDGWEGVEK